MKVCLVSCQYPPLSRTYRRYQFARLLAEGGCDVEVVAHGNISTALGSFTNDPDTGAAMSTWPVHRPTAVPWYLAGEVLYRAGLVACPYVNWVRPAARVAERVARGSQDVVCGIYPPLSNHIVAWRAARRTGARLVLDFRDEYLGLAHGPRWIQARRWQRRLLERADLVSVATAAIGEGFAAQGLDSDRVHLTQNGYWETPPSIPPYPARGRARLVYVGALSPAQGVEVLCDAMARLGRQRQDLAGRVEAVIYGPDNRYRRRVLAARLVPGVTYGGYLPAGQVTGVLLDADLAFLSLASETFSYAVPGKLYDYIAHGRPILASLPDGSARRLIESEGIGRVAPCADGAALAGLLAELTDPGLRRALHERVLQVRERHAAAPHFLSLARRVLAL